MSAGTGLNSVNRFYSPQFYKGGLVMTSQSWEGF
jgi:hypothetical protein